MARRRPDPLPAEDLALLRFAGRTAGWHEDRLTAAVLEAFGCTLTRYHQRLYRALQHPAAEAAEPTTVHRLRRLIDQRTARVHATPRGA